MNFQANLLTEHAQDRLLLVGKGRRAHRLRVSGAELGGLAYDSTQSWQQAREKGDQYYPRGGDAEAEGRGGVLQSRGGPCCCEGRAALKAALLRLLGWLCLLRTLPTRSLLLCFPLPSL